MANVEAFGRFDKDWRINAACRDEDPDACFPVSEKNPKSPAILAAKRICARCVVVDACLDEALRMRVPFGIWGGLATVERDAILKRKLRAS